MSLAILCHLTNKEAAFKTSPSTCSGDSITQKGPGTTALHKETSRTLDGTELKLGWRKIAKQLFIGLSSEENIMEANRL